MAGRRHGALGAAARRDRRDPECADLRARAASRAGQGRHRAARAAVAAAGQPAGAGLEGAAGRSSRATSPVEPMQLFGARLLDDPLRLAGLAAPPALLDEVLAEREPHPRLYAGLLKLLEGMLARPALAGDLGPLRAAAAAGAGLRARSRPLRGHRCRRRPRLCLAAHRPCGVACGCRRSGRPPVAAAGLPGRRCSCYVRRCPGRPAAVRPLPGRQALAPADKPLPAVRERLITLVRQRSETTA